MTGTQLSLRLALATNDPQTTHNKLHPGVTADDDCPPQFSLTSRDLRRELQSKLVDTTTTEGNRARGFFFVFEIAAKWGTLVRFCVTKMLRGRALNVRSLLMCVWGVGISEAPQWVAENMLDWVRGWWAWSHPSPFHHPCVVDHGPADLEA